MKISDIKDPISVRRIIKQSDGKPAYDSNGDLKTEILFARTLCKMRNENGANSFVQNMNLENSKISTSFEFPKNSKTTQILVNDFIESCGIFYDIKAIFPQDDIDGVKSLKAFCETSNLI